MSVSVVSNKPINRSAPFPKGLASHLKEVVYAPYAKSLIQQINHSNLSFNLFSSCIDYLSSYSHAGLQSTLTDKLKALPFSQARELLMKKVQQSSSLKRVWQTKLSLADVEAICAIKVMEEIKRDQGIVPRYDSKLKQASQQAANYFYRNSSYFGKITQFFVKVFFLNYKIDINKPPKEQWQAQAQIASLRMIVEDVCVVGALVAAYFPSYLAITAVACAALVTLAVLVYVYMRYKLGTPEQLSSIYGSNLNLRAKEYGSQQRTSGRLEEMKLLEEQLSSYTEGTERYVPIILGPPGSGKTQLMQGLALKIVEGNVNHKLLGKQILAINSQSLASGVLYDQTEGTTNRLEQLFSSLKGLEDQFILFFDEAHNLMGKQDSEGFGGSSTNNLEDLKCKILESGIQCVFATTEQEYQKSIALNKAIVSRLHKPITLKPLPDADVVRILKNKPKDPGVIIKSDVYDAILPIAKKLATIERLKELIEPLTESLGTLNDDFFKDLMGGTSLRESLENLFGDDMQEATLQKADALSDKVALIIDNPELNPRIADQVLGRALGYVRAFRPLRLEKASEQACHDYNDQLLFMQQQRQDDETTYQRDYEENSKKLAILQANKDKLATLLQKQQKQIQRLEQLSRDEIQAKEKRDELTYCIGQNPKNQELQKEYVFVTKVMIPDLEQRKQEVLNSFKTAFTIELVDCDSTERKRLDFNEDMIPRSVTVDILQELYR